MMETRERLIEIYFNLGFKQTEILYFLASKHRIVICLRTLQNILRRLAFYRRKYTSPILDVTLFILEILRGSGKLHGYRWMHAKCIADGIVVSYHVVRHLLSILDPEGVDKRKKRRLRRRQYNGVGPNFNWHMDSYDKLKPYGICINGCIDGFSRKIIWMEANYTSSDPLFIAGYYIKSVIKLNGCPCRVRADFGTENKSVKDFQTFFRRNHGDRFVISRPTVGYGDMYLDLPV